MTAAAVLLLALPAAGRAAETCVPVGAWVWAAHKAPVPAGEILDRAAAAPVVLLGERHDSAVHHRWQLDMIQALHERGDRLAIGMEMVPRRLQPALDRWVAGETDEPAFLAEVEWQKVWGFASSLYLPIMRFAREHRIPLVALNVERALVSRVGDQGWAVVPAGEREGVGDPARPDPGYVARLGEIYASHQPPQAGSRPADPDDPAFRRFVEAQLLWDRAMAERIAETRRTTGRQVAAIMGAGHLENRLGVPHQLTALGIPDALVLLPWDRDRECGDLTAGIADAVQGVSDRARPRLGVALGGADSEGAAGEGVRVAAVSPDSVADRAGVKAGDLVVRAGDWPVRQPQDLIDIVRRHPPSVPLPITVRRDAATMELLARFPD